MSTVEIYVELLNEGTPTVRATQAEEVGKDLYKILPTEFYDPEDEEWAFVPGTIVRCVKLYDEEQEEEYLQAVEEV